MYPWSVTNWSWSYVIKSGEYNTPITRKYVLCIDHYIKQFVVLVNVIREVSAFRMCWMMFVHQGIIMQSSPQTCLLERGRSGVSRF